MKKYFAYISILFIGWITFAQSSLPAFPMTLHGNIKIWSSNLNWWTLKVYNWTNEINSYDITESGKYWSANVYVPQLLLNSFEWNLTFKLNYNWKNYVIDSIDDTNRWEWCPDKSNITFASANCRYDLTFKEEKSDSGSTSAWWGGGWWSSNKSDSKTTTWNATTKTTTTWNTNTFTWNDTIATWNNISNQNTWSQQINSNQWEKIDTQTNNWSRYHEWDQQKKLSHWYTLEQTNAYTFARINSITTATTIFEANLTWKLTRIAMAKMLSNYAINVLWKKPDISKKPFFDDVSDGLNSKYDHWVTHAYQLWIMWIWINSFRPNDIVTRWEFATALSRMLYNTPDGEDKYYSTHINVLYNKWIISNTDATMKEIRWYVMLMLMRSAQQ